MKYIWLIIITIFSLNLDAKEWEFNASGYYENKEMKLADNTKLLHYESKATWRDTFGNYGKAGCYGSIFIGIDGKRLGDLVICEYEDINGEQFWTKAERSGSEWQAGVGTAKVISATNKYKHLIGTKCIYAISYYKDTFHGKTKCNST